MSLGGRDLFAVSTIAATNATFTVFVALVGGLGTVSVLLGLLVGVATGTLLGGAYELGRRRVR